MIIDPRITTQMLVNMSISNTQRDFYQRIQGIKELTHIDIMDVEMYAKKSESNPGILTPSSNLIIGSCISDSLYQKETISQILQSHSINKYLCEQRFVKENEKEKVGHFFASFKRAEPHETYLRIFPESMRKKPVPVDKTYAFYFSKIKLR